MFLSVIIPAYNEEKRLPETLKKVRDYLMAQDYSWEVIVVNDGSTDKTAQTVGELFESWNVESENLGSSFVLIDNRENQGKGAVVKQGMLVATGVWRLFMDADNSTDISEVEKLFNFTQNNASIDNSYEVIIGSRYLDKNSIKVKQPLMRRVVSRMGNILVRLLLGIKSVDTQCGFKLFSSQAAQRIFPLQTITRWGFDMEILTIALRKGYKIKEVAVSWSDAEGSQVKKSAAIKTLKELIEIKRNMILGKYR